MMYGNKDDIFVRRMACIDYSDIIGDKLKAGKSVSNN